MAGHKFKRNLVNGRSVHFGNVYYSESSRPAHESSGVLETGVARRQMEPVPPDDADPSALNELYCVPRCSLPQFVGRQLLTEMVTENLKPTTRKVDGDRHKIVVLYGLGGSGKTQFCLRFAETNRSR